MIFLYLPLCHRAHQDRGTASKLGRQRGTEPGPALPGVQRLVPQSRLQVVLQRQGHRLQPAGALWDDWWGTFTIPINVSRLEIHLHNFLVFVSNWAHTHVYVFIQITSSTDIWGLALSDTDPTSKAEKNWLKLGLTILYRQRHMININRLDGHLTEYSITNI